MPGPFAVTTVTNSIRLDAQRCGEAVFTVFNASGRPFRGRARLIPANPAATAWLALDGEAERDFPIAGTQQYSVQIVLPPSAPPGSYPFRLDMVGVENPDEQYTQGPTVTFEAPAPLPQKKRFPWWILAVIAGVLAIACVVVAAVLLWPKNVQVPDVARQRFPDAVATLNAVELQTGDPIEAPSDTVTAGVVIASTPEAGTEVKRGSAVTLIVSSGPVMVTLPDVSGKIEADARQALETLCAPSPCLNVQVQYESSLTGIGLAMRTDPAVNSQVAQGSLVILVVAALPIEGTNWVLESLGGNAVLPDTTITLQLSEGSLGGSSGCNSYGGKYQLGEQEMTISDIFSTLMACLRPDGVMGQEHEYLTALESATKYQITADRLEIFDNTGASLLVFVAQ